MATVSEILDVGRQYEQLGDFRQAEQFYRQALQAEPDHFESLYLLGKICAKLGKQPDAVDSLRRAAALNPSHDETHNHLGIALSSLGNFDEAAAAFRQAIRLRPDRVYLHSNLGNTLRQLGQLDEAIESLQAALRLDPTYVGAHYNLGIALEMRGQLAEAVTCYRHLIQLSPYHADAYARLGLTLARLGKSDEALSSLEQSLALNPSELNYAGMRNNQGVVFYEQRKLDEAMEWYERSLQHMPDYAVAHRNRALVWLMRGNWEKGWPEYEWRWRCKDTPPPPFSQPRWDGTPFPDQTVLLYAEQGLGDTIHFIRYAPLVKQRGGQVILQCPVALAPILQNCAGIDQLITEGSPPVHFDFYAPLMSLPGLFGTTTSSVPAEVPYLTADVDRVNRWKEALPAGDVFKIGIVWQGNTRFAKNRDRSIPLECFELLAQLPGVRLISLQKGDGSKDLKSLAGRFPIIDLGDRLDEQGGAFMDTAAVMKNLDLVITCDTAAAHLAGALGVPVWTALAYVADWRWLLDRDDTPWYPTMRLFRQTTLGNWREVLERMAAEIKHSTTRGSRIDSIRVEIAPGELIDKITILEIKSERVVDPAKLLNIHLELATLVASRDEAIASTEELTRVTAELKAVNIALWQIEDDIRACERGGDFGPRFVELARSVYRQNDRRAALKRQINDLLGSKIIEEKAYAVYE